MRRWAVGNVHTGQEINVASQITREGATVFCPIYTFKTKRRGPGRNEQREISKAVWPGYLLVDSTTITNEEKLRYIPDFHYFLFYPTGHKKLISDAIVGGLRALEKSGALTPQDMETLMGRVPVGSEIRVGGGIFGGWRGIVGRVSENYARVEGGDFTFSVDLPMEILEICKGE